MDRKISMPKIRDYEPNKENNEVGKTVLYNIVKVNPVTGLDRP